ncbi:SMP-30/gluconolactonase/LRE family protein [Gracilimonas mengyeensis]|uniref:Gluconolactonase n=1 Tax=Gracilimonas mengyeensis TaxID=1302730 RepID=A0A521DSG3_9BACT|nr:SMP-30/gluconolactonase/LRE family protein [Gracilimonas mengyeensis]SMO73810.1 gluconolactonase [Gracilimonas mengyeensis]
MKKVVYRSLLIIGLVSFGGFVQAQDLVKEGAEIQQITAGHQFTEGPFWHEDGFLLYSDIPANKIFKWTPEEQKTIFLDPSGNSNGITDDLHGGMVIAQHAGKVSQLDAEGNTTLLLDSYQGKRFNSPNDLMVTSDGTLYFTDPPYGVQPEDRELDFCGVYRWKDGMEEAELLFDEFETPNGLVFAPDESRFYVNDTQTGQIYVFDIDDDGTVSEGSLFAEVGPATNNGAADGMVVDENGNLYSTGPGGIHIFDAEGNKLTHIETPETVTNLDWGREGNQTLFMTSPTGIYTLEMNVNGWW